MKNAIVVLVCLSLSGCTGITESQRYSLQSDLTNVERANKQSASELAKIIEAKDQDIKMYAPAYARENGYDTSELGAVLDDTNKTSLKAKGYLKDIEWGAEILRRAQTNLAGGK